MKAATIKILYRKAEDSCDALSVWDFEVKLDGRTLRHVRSINLDVDANKAVPLVRIETFDRKEVEALISEIYMEPVEARVVVHEVKPRSTGRIPTRRRP